MTLTFAISSARHMPSDQYFAISERSDIISNGSTYASRIGMPTSTHALVATTIATTVGLADPAVGCKDEFERVVHDEELQARLEVVATFMPNTEAARLRGGDAGLQ
jgi:hypothetical protein